MGDYKTPKELRAFQIAGWVFMGILILTIIIGIIADVS